MFHLHRSDPTDSNGDIYSVNGYDEAHYDVIKWSSSTGHAVKNTGNPITIKYGMNLEGLAVEPNGSIVYTVGVTGVVPTSSATYSKLISRQTTTMRSPGRGMSRTR